MTPSDDAFDRLAAGVVLLDPEARVVRLNRAALTIVEANDGFMLAGDTLRTLSLERTLVLRELVDEAIKTGSPVGVGSGSTMEVERPGNRQPWAVLVLPLLRQMSPKWHADAVAAVFIYEPATRTPGAPETESAR